MGDKPLAGDQAPSSSLAFLLSQVGHPRLARFAERIAEIDLHPPLFRVLNMVDAAEGRPSRRSARRSGRRPAAWSRSSTSSSSAAWSSAARTRATAASAPST